ncbi:MAG: carbonic anhydrase [Candidatus Binataceae bacterium]|nr:carbonic anhydrase [Candidatus Binataceae bacterium]
MTDTQILTRRNVLRLGALSGILALLPKGTATADPVLGTICNPNRPTTPQDALTALTDGNTRWSTQTQQHPGEDTTRRDCVASNAQTPFAAILSCSDSRVPPELLFDQGLGDLFVSRVAGNSAARIVEESLGYGTKTLGSLILFVLGHSDCGAVKAAVASYPRKAPEFVELIYPAVRRARKLVRKSGGDPRDPAQVVPVATDQHVLMQADRLRKKDPFRHLIAQKVLMVAGGRYDLSTQQVAILLS